MKVLTVEKDDLEFQLRQKESDLVRLKSQSEILFVDEKSSTNVVNERVIELNKLLVDAQKKTLDAKAFALAVQAAVKKGEDLQQFALQLSENVGEELLKNQMGVGTQDSWTIARIQEQLIEDKAELTNKLSVYGANHPFVQEIQKRIQSTENWLKERNRTLANGVNQLGNADFGPRLVQMALHRYNLAYTHEYEIYNQFVKEKKAAMGLNQQMAQIEI